MIPLDRPIKRLLRGATSDASTTRMWNRIDARTRAAAGSPSRERWGTAKWSVAAVVLVAAAFAIVFGNRPLFFAGADSRGGVLAISAEQAGDAEKQVALADRSTLLLGKGAAFEPLESSATAVALRQSRGRIDYDVTPGGPRRWTIECGLVTVEVVGTSFRIDRTPARVRVDVTRGIVLVRGERVPDHVARLTAGMSLEVTAQAAEPSLPASSLSPSPPSSIAIERDTPRPFARPASPWRESESRGDHAQAYADLGPDGIARVTPSASIDDLLALADVARLSGHPREAIAPLERLMVRHANDRRASLAAYTLGRIQLRSLGAPAAAATAFERAIAMDIPIGLAEDTYALWIESLADAGDRAGVARAYAGYTARFPQGTRDDEIRKWLSPP